MATRKDRAILYAKAHTSARRACGSRWTGEDGLTHLCRSHVVVTGECLCPCGMRTAPLRPDDGKGS